MQNIKDLEKEILRHKVLYYQGHPEITDDEFDQLEEKLKKLDPKNKVLQMIGAPPKSGKVSHEKKMLSLNKTYQTDDLIKWKGDNDLVSTYKIDGVSCSLVYEEGSLRTGKTRGDGSYGENITQKVMWLNSIPKSISKDNGLCEVRGELLCAEENFKKLSKKMLELGLEQPTSLRNIVAGLISRKDHLQLCSYLDFLAFEVIGLEDIQFELEKFDFLRKNGFEIPEIKLHKHEKSIKEAIEETRTFMINGHMQIDGVVFTINELSLHEELGETAHHPRYKMAFKFQGDSKTTKIRSISWSISRNGIFTPVAEVEPVTLSGAKINRVTLHNFGVVRDNNLKSGDKIEIIRSGEVIPKFIGLVECKKGSYEIPEECPYCHSKIVEEDIRIFCKNKKCPGRNREVILNFIQKIGIDEISGKRLDEMMRIGLVESVADLFKLKKEDFLNLEKVKEKLAEKFVSSIDKGRRVDLTTFVASLGLTGGAFNKSQKIVDYGFNSLEKLRKLTVEQLVEVESFAEKSAGDFLDSLKEKKEMIDSLLKAGVEITEASSEALVLSGKKICITGSLSEKRSVIEDKIRSNGGTVVSSVSKNTDYLLTNEESPSSSKGKKAFGLGIPLISEEKLSEIISN